MGKSYKSLFLETPPDVDLQMIQYIWEDIRSINIDEKKFYQAPSDEKYEMKEVTECGISSEW